MKPIRHGCNTGRFHALAIPAILILAVGSLPGQEKSGGVIPPSVLGAEYVDILNGFSLRPAAGFELNTNFSAEDSAGGYREGAYSLTSWDALKTLSSKPLVGCVEPRTGTELILSVLSPRHPMKIKEMLEGRIGFWKQVQENTQAVSYPEEVVNDRPAGWLEVTIPGSGEGAPARRICEALIQQDPGRYFSLIWSVKGTGVLEFPSETNDQVVRNFTSLKEESVKQRWNQARKQAQQLLEAIRPKVVKSELRKDLWFGISYQGQDIGFRRVQQQAWKTEDKKYIEIDWQDSFLSERGTGYLQSRGLYPVPMDEESAIAWLSRVAAVQGKILLQEDCKSETSELQYRIPDEATSVFQEDIRWSSGTIEVRRQQRGITDSYLESMKVKDATYLGQGLWELFGRLGELKPNQEFLFNRYHQGQLDYCYIRVIRVAAGAGKKDPKAGSAPAAADQPDGERATYLIAKMGLSGPAVELWMDGEGTLTQWRCNGFVGARQEEAAIRSRWPAEAERVRF